MKMKTEKHSVYQLFHLSVKKKTKNKILNPEKIFIRLKETDDILNFHNYQLCLKENQYGCFNFVFQLLKKI